MSTRHCKYCCAEHPFTAEFWYRMESYPRCKAAIARRKKAAYDPEKQRIHNTAYRAKHREHLLEENRKWRKKNAEKHRQNAMNWYWANREHVIKRHSAYMRKREHEDVSFKLSRRVRTRLYHAVKGISQASAVRDLGCSVEFLKQYLEGMFYGGMAWDNYGKLWEIDHIMPLANYNLQDRSTLRHLVHYTNLQPLLKVENKRKSNKEL